MKLRYTLGMLMIALLLLGSGVTPGVTAQEPAGSQLRLLSFDEQAIVLELTMADFRIETVEQAGRAYHRVIIPGTVQTATPGEPQVPARGTLLGLPTAEGVSVQVLEASYQVLRGHHLPPAPALQVLGDDVDAPVAEILTLDQDRYASDAFYPGRPVEIGHTGYLRDQAVAQVQFYPVQYNPVTGEVRLYRRILARVTWEALPSTTTAETRWGSPAYERLLRKALLNYEALGRTGPTKVVTTNLQSSPPRVRGAEGTCRGKGLANPPGAEDSGLREQSPSGYVCSPVGALPFQPGVFSAGPSPAAVTPTLKIGVTADGLYELTCSDLTGAGLDLSAVDPRTLKLSHRGVEIPIYVAGEGDGVFDPGDTLLFYGTGLNDVYTIQNVYWLTAGGEEGQRMGTRDGTASGSGPVATHFPGALHAEEDTSYWVTMPNGQGQDHWFWGDKLTAPASQDCSLTLNNISTAASTTTVRVRLKGRTDTSTYPDHHTRIYLNGIEIDEQLWDGFRVYDHQVTVPHSYLTEGDNTVRVEGVGDTGAAVDQFYLNWIEVDYWDTYVAENDELLFGAPGAGRFQFEATGFTGADVDVFDVTDPARVVRITNTSVVADGSGYRLQFEDTAQPETRYLAVTPRQRRAPACLKLDQPSSWKSPSNGADYILITHGDFTTSALRLAEHRSASGLRVATVEVRDIYDEFNHGIFNPQAIRDFLTYAYDYWVAPAPTYVLLLGGASYDYRDLLDLDRATYVPTQIIETDELGQTPSDNWFVLVSGADILPDMFIGRLTAQDRSEANDMVTKIIHYEQHPPDDSWNTQVLLVADDEPSFEVISEQLAGLLPFHYTANKVYTDDYPPGDPTADITDHINSGSVLVNYAGHGNVDRWGSWSGGHIFNRADVTALNNTEKLPVVSIANCLNGYFAGKNVSMAEEFLLRDDRGAAAVWAASGLGYPSGHQVLMGEFYEAIFQDEQYALGAATTAAKIATYAQSGYWGELVETFVLFGDPATPLGIPTNYPYVKSTTPAHGAGDVPIDQNLQVVFNIPMDPATVVLSGLGTSGLVLTPTWSARHTALDYAHTNFGHGQTLTFTIHGQDELGNPLEPGVAPDTWSFAVTNDAEPPRGTIGIEGDEVSDVPVTATVTITFTEPMRTSAVAYAIVPSVMGGLAWGGGEQLATFHHADFQRGECYTFIVTAAKDLAGNPLSGTLTLTFATQESNTIYLPLVVKNQ